MAERPRHKYTLLRERVPQLRLFRGYSPEVIAQRELSGKFRALPPLPDMVDMRHKCPPVFFQGDVGSCHDPATEVLTRDGWRFFADLTGSELLASVDPATSRLVYEKPTRLVRLHFDGELVVFRGDSLDFKVTPNHRMLIREWDESKGALEEDYKFVVAEDVGPSCGFMSRVVWEGEKASQSALDVLGRASQRQKRAWLQFLGVYLAKGRPCFGRSKIRVVVGGEREGRYVRNLSHELRLEFSERIFGSGTSSRKARHFTFSDGRVCEKLTRLGSGGIRAPRKYVPAFVFGQSGSDIALFLLGYRAGSVGGKGRLDYYAPTKSMADDLQRLLFLSGEESRIWTRKSETLGTWYRVSVSKMEGSFLPRNGPAPSRETASVRTEAIESATERKRTVTRERYTGKVFCAEVPSYHTLVTRRGSRILISGNCTAQALVAIYMFDDPREMLSRLFLYYNEREIDGRVDSDEGSTLSCGIGALKKFGICSEQLWPYDESKWNVRPPPECYQNAKERTVVCSSQVEQNVESMRACLASGEPIALGIQVYESFESSETGRTGLVQMPKPTERCYGGHAVVCVGYDNKRRLFIMRNSWGQKWGDQGYFYLPYQYLTNENLTSDLWIITKITEPTTAPEVEAAKFAPRLKLSPEPGLELMSKLKFLRAVRQLLRDIPPPEKVTLDLVSNFMEASRSSSLSHSGPQCATTIVGHLLEAAADPDTPLSADGAPRYPYLINREMWPSTESMLAAVNGLLSKVGLRAEIASSRAGALPGTIGVEFLLRERE